MKERPILFSAPMVRAILEGRKTQTRRVVKFPAKWEHDCHMRDPMDGKPGDPAWPHCLSGDGRYHKMPCPYGQPGDRLWVRETFMPMPHLNAKAFYRATDPLVGGKWKPSIFMPRDLSRLTLEITEIRVERLNAITDEDAGKEGVSSVLASLGTDDLSIGTIRNYLNDQDQKEGKPVQYFTGKNLPRARFASLWQSINGPDSWAANPWVWVVTFRPLPSDS
jgi:hypothetical protein